MTSKKPTPKKGEKTKDSKSKLFVNPNGVLCYTVVIFGHEIFTMIGVQPYLYDKRGCVEDWRYKHT